VNDLGGASGLVPVRNLVQVGDGGRATVIERFHLGTAGVVELPLTEVICGIGAEVDHVKLVGGAAEGEHHGSTHVVQGQDSVYRSWEIVTGGALTRRELHLGLRGTGARCDLNALYMGADSQRFDLRTRVSHEAPGCETRELYKGVLDDRARGVFDGLIRVARGSQQTNAHQTNRNLLLSGEAVVNSIPRLEIYADDVKCSHGSTTGQLDEDHVFYLRTRGFSPTAARAYLAWAFASEVVDTLPVAGLRDELALLVAQSLESAVGRLDGERGR
jgi:Fe-S cluster assembly protein SufD